MSYNFTHIKGDTFEAVNFALLKNNVVINLTGATIRMQLRTECGGLIALSLTSVASAGITITNAAGGLFRINQQIINIASGNYLYDLEILFADGTVKTWLSGEFLIECDITR
jgi:hypothetical protein